MLTSKKIAAILIVCCLGYNTLLAQKDDPQLEAMGSVRYILQGEWNRFNLFDLGNNPAGFHTRDSLNWLRVWSSHEITRGDFHRSYDPKQKSYSEVSFAGAKRLDKNQTFWGQVSYWNDQIVGMPFALERNPYAADPFILADSSTGGYRYWGPSVFVLYSRKLSSRINIGGELQYVLDSAVRDEESMVGITQRNLVANVGVKLQLFRQLTTGITYTYQNYYDRTEVPKRQDGRAPVTYRYRGYIVSRKELRRYQRNALDIHHQIGSQWLFRPTQGMNLLVKGGYHFQYSDLFDGESVRHYEAYWEKTDYTADLIFKYSAQTSPWRFSGFGHLCSSSDWSKHYRLPVLITDQTRDEYEYGIGMGYVPDHGLYRLGLEVSAFNANYDLSDYIGHTKFTADVLAPEIRMGGEYFFNESFSIKTGIQYRDFQLTGEIPYRIDSHAHQSVHVGFTLWQKNYHLELISNYGWDSPEQVDLGDRKYFDIMLNSKFILK